jgi:hypothetical protein
MIDFRDAAARFTRRHVHRPLEALLGDGPFALANRLPALHLRTYKPAVS